MLILLFLWYVKLFYDRFCTEVDNVQEASSMVDLGEVRKYLGELGDHDIITGCIIAGDTQDLLEGKSFPSAEQQ